ncbi:retrovirus-related pol polyprotein from transposon TNT 1-94 [Tanacetum coccineum]
MCVAQVVQPQVNPDSTIAQVEQITPFSDVHQVGDEREVEVLRSFNWPPSELITDDGVLPERDRRLSISEEALAAFGKGQPYSRARYYGRGYGLGQEANRNKSKLCKIMRAKNTVEDRIMDSGASFHATYCKEELKRFKLHSDKVRLANDKTLDIAGVGDVVLKTSFGTSWTLKDVRWFGEAEEYFLHNVSKDKETAKVGASSYRSRSCGRYNANLLVKCLKFENGREYSSSPIKFCVENRILMLKMVPETPLQFGVAERLSRTFRAESTGIHVEALKMLWADSVSTTYLIYRIPYVPIRLRIPEEEWRGKDTSLTHLKVFGCDSFVKVKDVCEEAMKCTFIGSGSDEMRYSFWDTKSHQVIQSKDITFVDSIYGARSATYSSSLMKTIQKKPRLSENSGSFEDSGKSDEEYSEDGASSKEEGSEIPHVRRSTRESKAPWKKAIIEEMVSLEKNQTCSLVRFPAGKKASQSLWMFRVKEEQDGSKRYKARLVEPSYVGALNDTSTQHKSEGFQLAGQEENLECRLKEILWFILKLLKVDDMLVAGSDMLVFEMKNRCSEKQVLGYVLTVGVTTVEYTKSSIHLVKNLKVCSWAKLVQILISEGSLSLLKILGTKSLAAMFTRLVMKEKLKFCVASTSL